MNHWRETAGIVAQLEQLGTARRSAALATVVAIEGSAYRRPGAKMLVTEEGATLGSVSGGCLEADVREIARAVISSGRSELRSYDTESSQDEIVWGLGLGCGGRVDVFVQPALPGPLADLAPRLAERLRGDAPFTLATRIGGAFGEPNGALLLADATSHGSLGSVELDRRARIEALALAAEGRSAIRALDGVEVFFERMSPPTHLVVCGAGDDAQALVACADEAGFRVTLVDHRPALLTRERFPRATGLVLARPETREVQLPAAARSLAVVKLHSFALDREWARRLLAAGVPFVGLLGPRARGERIREEIGASPAAPLFGPVGLDLGAEGANQIAISIVSQLLAFLARRVPRPLAERARPIHAG